MNPVFMDLESSAVKHDSPGGKTVVSPAASLTMDPRLHKHDSPSKRNSPGSDDFPSPHARVEGLDEMMQLGNDFMPHDPSYNDMLMWPDYPLDLEMYPGNMPLGRADVPMPTFAELSDVSSNSEQLSSSRGSIHTRSTSIMSSADYEPTLKPVEVAMASSSDVPEFEAVLAAEASWPLARCNPPMYSGSCPRTAIVHLESLEQKCQQDNTWDNLEKDLGDVDWDASDLASVIPLQPRTRDNMLAITQSFLHKALEIHRGGYGKDRYGSPGLATFLVLPPSKILEYFLRSCTPFPRSLDAFSFGPATAANPAHCRRAEPFLLLLARFHWLCRSE